ncbi:MAG: DinB family protein [Candidatus Thermoplasmatota archaeon]|nr:DinB family protein [Candidatus Thermoplasmatota archaeon]
MKEEQKLLVDEFILHSRVLMDLLGTLNKEVLSESPVAKCGSFGKQFRHMIDVEKSYLEALEVGKLDYYRSFVDHSHEADKESLERELKTLNGKVIESVGKYNHDEFGQKTIDGTKASKYLGASYRRISPREVLLLLIEHLIFHEGELALYCRSTNRKFPDSWFLWGL